MSKNFFIFSLFFFATHLNAIVSSTLQTGGSVVPNDKPYYKHSMENVEIIHTREHLEHAKRAANIETPLNKLYELLYDWKLDETLYIGLASNCNQIANGFSTQWPNNRQINYVGGTQMVDYFTTTSWLDTLLFHETAHNYQMNLKANIVSQGLHGVFGNGSVLLPLPLTTPNFLENSFMLEGNAVLNESWHGNGGRLYSGRFKAQTILQAKAGNITPAYMYNARVAFPYGEMFYIQGGFFNLYLARKYGMLKVNSYFKYHSEDWWLPIQTNASMKDAIGVDFEDALEEFANEYKKLGEKFVSAGGETLATSQFFSSLGNNKNEIFFITNSSGVRAPELIRVDKNSLVVSKQRGSWESGKVVEADFEYYTQGSRNTSATMIEQGLYDSEGFIKEGANSKMVQGYLGNGDAVYFDVNASFTEPRLFIGDRYYGTVNSSVIIDDRDNIYYFKQKGKIRTLYKNKTPLFLYEGFYGMVSDVDSKGVIYFVANSELGSTLYSLYNGVVKRVSLADNIVEARLIDDNRVLIAAISDKDYYYVINDLKNIDEMPYETKLYFEDREYYGYVRKHLSEDINHSTLHEFSQPYNSLFEMHYSGTDVAYGSLASSLDIKFADPLLQNSASIFIKKDNSEVVVAGAEYASSRYLLGYKLLAYKVVDKGLRNSTREGGVAASASLPLYKAGYYNASAGLSYYQDYDVFLREPISATLNLSRSEAYGVSMYPNYVNSLRLFGVVDRGDKIVGAEYDFKHDLPYEFYFGAGGKFSYTSADKYDSNRGVKISQFAFHEDMDPSIINMPNLIGSFFAKSVKYGDISLAKVFNISSYFFTTPLSLQRESIYVKYRYYDVEYFGGGREYVNEYRAGATLGTVFLNKFSIPVSLEYIYNDVVRDSEIFRVKIEASF